MGTRAWPLTKLNVPVKIIGGTQVPPAPPHATVLNLVPRAFPLKNPFFKGKALGTRLLRYCKYTI